MKISLSNIGSIKGSSIKIGDLTVIAGENDTGKSTFGKVLYSIVKSYNTYSSEVNRSANRILMSNFKSLIDVVRESSRAFNPSQLTSVHSSLIKLQQAIFSNKDIDLELKNLTDSLEGSESIFATESFGGTEHSVRDLNNEVGKFYHNYIKTRHIKFDEDKYCKYAHDILKSEFVGRIVSKKDETSSISIDFSPSLDKRNSFNMSFNDVRVESYKLNGINNFNFRDVTFVDSPAILQYYQALSNISIDNISSFNVPHHVMDVLSKLKTSKIKNGLDDRIKIIDSYDGEMIINDDLTQFLFKKNNEVYPSGNVASGVKAVSIIEMLYEGGNISGDTIIIIDEPETNLHPKWQVEYAKSICKLVNMGCKFLITTHSPYMIEAFKVYSDKEKDVVFYYSSKSDGDVKYKDTHGEVNEILECLSKPFDQIMEDSGNYDF